MIWNFTAECVSGIILVIIWIYSRKGNPLPTLQNRYFEVCFVVTFCSIVSNIAATLMLPYYQTIPISLLWAINLFYFLVTPLMGAFYFNYLMAFVLGDPKTIYRILPWTSIPAFIYILLVLSSPFTGWIFTIDPVVGYMRGPLIFFTYLLFYLYCLACPFLVFIKGNHLDASILRILISFPIIAIVVIIFQSFAPSYILSGSAATCALLIIYLYLQNKQISIDHLTNLPNRQEFLKMLDLKINHRKDSEFTVLVVSLRHFKLTNDTFGQQNGNLFLMAVASYLRSITNKNQVYRYNGDEFSILLNQVSRTEIERLYDEISKRMTQLWEIKGFSSLLDYAVGVARYPYSSDTLEGFIDGLEWTTAQAKHNPPHFTSYCTTEMFAQLKRKNQITEVLTEHLANDSFEIYYQPVLSLNTQKFDKAEALLRLNNTSIGPVFPDEFIPIAEETGLIIDMTYQILRKICWYIKSLLDEGKDFTSISVNFSSKQFVQSDVAQRVLEIIDSAGIPYSKIKIEITESVLTENPKPVIEFINFIHAKGVLFALDDFGTGYSNISIVLGIPLHTIKLDKSLVWSAVQSPRSELLVRHLVAAFKGLGLDLVAEGVENEAQRAFVEDCGCDMIQGFLYSKPLPADEAKTWIGEPVGNAPQTFTAQT